MDVERVLIACSAALVLLLSIQNRGMESEPYEVPLEEIPQSEVAVSAAEVDTQQTVVYYEDGDGYLVPVQRDVMRQEGIAKATLELMVQSAKNDMDAARLGLSPIVPEGTTFDLDISQGHARVDMSSQVLDANDREQEENMRTAIVWALTEFDTVEDVRLPGEWAGAADPDPRHGYIGILHPRGPQSGRRGGGNICQPERGAGVFPRSGWTAACPRIAHRL